METKDLPKRTLPVVHSLWRAQWRTDLLGHVCVQHTPVVELLSAKPLINRKLIPNLYSCCSPCGETPNTVVCSPCGETPKWSLMLPVRRDSESLLLSVQRDSRIKRPSSIHSLKPLLLSHQSCSLVALKHNLFDNLYSWIAKKYCA